MKLTAKTALHTFIEQQFIPTGPRRAASQLVMRTLRAALNRPPVVEDLNEQTWMLVRGLGLSALVLSRFRTSLIEMWRCAHAVGILTDGPPASLPLKTQSPKDKRAWGRQAGTITRKMALTATMAKLIDEYVRLQAAGTSEAEIQKQLGKSEYQLKNIRVVHRDYFAERHAAAMEAVSKEIRAIAGTDKIFKLKDTYLAAAENADKWQLQKHGVPLFVPPPPVKIARGEAQHTLASFFESYYRPVCLAAASKETIRLYRLIVRRWVLLTGDPPLAEVTSLTFSKWRDAQSAMKGKISREVCSPNTVRCHIRMLQAMFDKAGPPDRRNRAGAGIIPFSPYIPPPKAEYGEPVITTEERVTACYAACGTMTRPRLSGVDSGAWWRALLVTVYNTGIRARTVFAMRMEHVDWDNGRLILPGEILKAGKKLILPLAPTVIEHLQTIRTERERVFHWPYTIEYFRRCFHELQNSAGIPPELHFGLHMLRRTLGTRLWKENPAAAQLMLGHSAIEITKRHYVNSEDVLGSLRNLKQPAAFVGAGN